MSNYKVLLFYKYVEVNNPEKLVSDHLDWCLQHDIRGRVFFAKEGVNGTVSGTLDNIEKYKKHLTSYPEFSDIWFKEDDFNSHAFKKMLVRLKKEIVHGDLENVKPEQGGRRLSPEELLKFYEEGKEFVIVDARNWYESMIGKFKNAITPPLKNFREWKHYVDTELIKYKDKPVVTYCTGGIRCEKASAYLVEKGFKEVYQINGGIFNFIKKFPDTYWEGGMFVFDERRVVLANSKPELRHIAKCHFCGELTSYYINCHNIDCDRIIVCCHDCKIKNEYCCSDECRKSPNKRKVFHG
ncbi:MAG: rhodanese-related sulfurtransferase [Ignavibacterium album]|uniref:oxygen-dependent tRNA uridine(34) hydroxylase TrhO n=1 Tax=Ignavibacterium album TaxID=591197 RepID=UPI0026F24211|nr:rhodanese-related sulfurtransferase [Ignavibacterium album]MCX8106219.1 rhodanese-related sulfurtransferase [Ignavibacterium album]